MTTATQDQELERRLAKQTVELFGRQFGEDYLLLAYYAALPLVLTPELVHYLRVEFLLGYSETVPWESEADLLLSDLCSPVGYELYGMDTAVRDYLIEEMKRDQRVPAGQMQRVAELLLSYVTVLGQLQPGQRLKELEAQRWAAMAFLGDEQVAALVAELAERFAQGARQGDQRALRADFARLARITEELASQLAQSPELLEFAAVVRRALRNLAQVTAAEKTKVYEVAGRRLSVTGTLIEAPVVDPDPIGWEGYPTIGRVEFEVGTLVREGAQSQTQSGASGQSVLRRLAYEFQVGLLEVVERKKPRGFNLRKRLQKPEVETEIVIRREAREGWQYRQSLGDGVNLDLVEIPAGTFMMGSPEDELESYGDERPQHEVTVPGFLMGKYPVTQAQWRFVAGLPEVNCGLDVEPSEFEGDARPVEQVSWIDAQEFCARLSIYAGRPYRLPSEAEWEYACRAGTITPFHFGETIDSELANYRPQDLEHEGTTYPGKYGRGRFGDYRKQTSVVGSLNAANNWGLHDMHGNVLEWCEDQWHNSYENAPKDGSAWIDETLAEKDLRLLRGGSWLIGPRYCRSACRVSNGAADSRNDIVGFRVVSDPART
jgi:formylglycine-generating enzyme required for sulfatase activity